MPLLPRSIETMPRPCPPLPPLAKLMPSKVRFEAPKRSTPLIVAPRRSSARIVTLLAKSAVTLIEP